MHKKNYTKFSLPKEAIITKGDIVSTSSLEEKAENLSKESRRFPKKSNAVIFIGANGAGKSRLAATIEKKNIVKVHRIGAQRSLNFKKDITVNNSERATKNLVYGSEYDAKIKSKESRWGRENEYPIRMLNDFDAVLSALIAKKNDQNDEIAEYTKKHNGKTIIVEYQLTVIDQLIQVWNEILPQRGLLLKNTVFYAQVAHHKNEQDEKESYLATNMSDGERSVLYFIAQVLCAEPNKILIIDELELHLHPSIISKLWKTLEAFRPDCTFVYITHDTRFAAEHSHADKIWIKSYDGQKWELEEITNEEDLPEELLLEILGSRKKVLFVEGESQSYDTQLYKEIYSDYHVIPCGSCMQVIERTRAFRRSKNLHVCTAIGLIDRDFRTDEELEKLASDGVYALGVAEVESLFLSEKLIRFLAKHLCKREDEVFNEVKNFVIEDRFKKQIEGQIRKATVAELKYKLSKISVPNEKVSLEDELKKEINSLSNIENTAKEKFEKALENKDYEEILRIFNDKGIIKMIGKPFGVGRYDQTILDLLKGGYKEEIIDAVRQYLPALA